MLITYTSIAYLYTKSGRDTPLALMLYNIILILNTIPQLMDFA